MATNRLPVQLLIRNATADTWTTRNPTLEQGEFGLENDTFLIKIGDGIRDWEHLPYLNALDETYFQRTIEGELTFSDSFATTIQNLIAAGGGSGSFIIENDPTNPTDPVNLRYLEWAIAHAGHLTRSIVQELPSQDIDTYNIYMLPKSNGVGYDEYMYIQGQWDMVGSSGSSGGGFTLEVATENRLGGVKASQLADHINVTQEGFMTLNDVSTSLLYVPDGDTLVLYGGTA